MLGFLANDNLPQFEFCRARSRPTSAFSLLLTDDRGTHAEKKGPLQCVNCERSAEEKVRLGEGAMGWCRKGKFQQSLLSPTPNGWLTRYLPSQERLSRREQFQGRNTLKPKR
jgi:hypothetical protein